MRVGVTRKVSPHARRLRRDMTDAEKRIWYALRDRRFAGWKFRRQETIGDRYVVDFICFKASLIVEIDGGQHSDEVDAERTAFLVAEGYRVIRFWNNDVMSNLEGVASRLYEALHHPHRCD